MLDSLTRYAEACRLAPHDEGLAEQARVRRDALVELRDAYRSLRARELVAGGDPTDVATTRLLAEKVREVAARDRATLGEPTGDALGARPRTASARLAAMDRDRQQPGRTRLRGLPRGYVVAAAIAFAVLVAGFVLIELLQPGAPHRPLAVDGPGWPRRGGRGRRAAGGGRRRARPLERRHGGPRSALRRGRRHAAVPARRHRRHAGGVRDRPPEPGCRGAADAARGARAGTPGHRAPRRPAPRGHPADPAGRRDRGAGGRDHADAVAEGRARRGARQHRARGRVRRGGRAQRQPGRAGRRTGARPAAVRRRCGQSPERAHVAERPITASVVS